MPDIPASSDLFAYGSLICEDIMAAVAGAQLQFSPAVLSGYRRFFVRSEHYPGIIASPGGKVDGRVYHNIAPLSWERLDRFEGEMYDRQKVVVHYQNSSEAVVDCYLFRREFIHRLTTIEWDFTRFLQGGKTRFQNHYDGFKDIA